MSKYQLLFTMILLIPIFAGCAKQVPINTADACDILQKNSSWYSSLEKAERKWAIPKSIILATIKQESSFKATAKPPRPKLLGFIPWFASSSAFGYSQALSEVWDEYKKETGRFLPFRISFSDSSDFIGWYHNKTVNELGISRNNAYALYLAYHEGRGGYKRKSYANKGWLIKVAKKVKKFSSNYASQLKKCDKQLPKGAWYNVIPLL